MDKLKLNKRKEWQRFAFGLAVILVLIILIRYIFIDAFSSYLLVAAFLIFIAGLLFPVLIKPIYVLFFYLSLVLGWISTRIILTVIFYLLITPIGLLARLFGKKFIEIGIDKKVPSYWISKIIREMDREAYNKQF